MKKLILIPLLVLAVMGFAQTVTLPYDSFTGRINYKQVTELPNSLQDKVYSNALKWLDQKYSPLIDKVILKDKSTGQICVKATLSEALTLGSNNEEIYLEHLLTIDAKDNKCRAQISDLKFQEYFEATEFTKAGWKEVPLEGTVAGIMSGKITGPKAEAYKKFLVAENVSINAILESFNQFLIQNDTPQPGNLNASNPADE